MAAFDDSLSGVLKYAFKLLGCRDRSEKELGERLKQKGFSEDIAREAVAYLKDRGFIDDRRFAEILKRAAVERKYLGSKGIKKYLMSRGIPSEIIADISEGDDFDFDTAKRLAEKKLRHMKGIDANDVRKRLWGALYRKGFQSNIINRVIKSCNLKEEE
ncbi:MAG: regulatory protein RecX [Thermodesulfovibrionales bacterium]|nr:regulatory protein RecX [Thermodesulfovibrionales bacterium]